MKSYKFLLAIVAVFGLTTGCSDQLDLQPEDSLTTQQVFSSEQGVVGALFGMYSAAQQDDALNGTLILSTEWQADNVDFVGSFPTFTDISTYETQSDNGSIESMYDDCYETIGAANNIIEFTPLVEDEGFTAEERAAVIAEAKFMRALIYQRINTLFGQPIQIGGGTSLGVQLVTIPVDLGGDPEPQRVSVNEINTLIEQDLMDAIPVLDNSDNSRATKGAAQALLARHYLYTNRFEDAARMANNAMNSGGFALASDYNFYNTQSPELFFTIVNTAADGQDSGQGFSGLTNPAPEGRGDAPFTQNLIDAYMEEDGDRRFTELIQTGASAPGPTRIFTSKFPDGITNSDNAPVLRFTEALLTRAEGNFRAGTTIGDTPTNDINRLRERAGLPPLAAVTLDIILNERRKELAFEGQRRMDLLRNNRSLRRPGMPQEAQSAPGADRTIYPIPQYEVEISNLQQNPGYGGN